ncbi:MAG: NAD(P)-dependent oxidoreductase [Bacteroidales bacterium]
MKVLITTKIFENSFDLLKNEGLEIIVPEEDFSKAELIDKISDCDFLLSTFKIPIDKEIIEAGKKLQMISNYGVGFNNVDIEYAKSKEIVVTNTPYTVTEPTAELAFGLLHVLGRKIKELDNDIRVPNKLQWGLLDNLSSSLFNKTLGIIGFGRIGQAVARRAVASNMKVIYYSRHQVNEYIENLYSVRYVPFDQLLETADYISLHVPLTEKTRHMIGAKELKKMKSTAYLVNTSRGPVINEQELAEALRDNVIAGAALDVFENEPKINDLLLTLDNAILLPHVGTATYETREETAVAACENIIKFMKNDKTLTRVN